MRRLLVAVGALAIGVTGLAACELGPNYGFTVSTGIDAVDAEPGDGLCEATAGAGDCTLRAAIGEASALAGAAVGPAPSFTVTLDADVTLSIAGAGEDSGVTGDLDVDLTAGALTIVGAGHRVDADGLDRALDIRRGSVSLDHVVVTGGRSTGVGGGVRTAGGTSATITRSTFVDNRSSTSGLCSIGRPFTQYCGAGFGYSGGGAIASDGDLFVAGSTFEQNAATHVNGGGCWVVDPQLLSYCYATWGGAILANGSLYIGISTFDRNTSVGPTSVISPFGDAVYATGTSEVAFITGTDNGPSASRSIVAGAVRNSIIVSTTCSAPVVDADHNLRSPEPCGPAVPSLLGALAVDGGATATRLPSATSPAVDAIPWAECLDYTIDQRAAPRVAGQPCDIGAVERQGDDP